MKKEITREIVQKVKNYGDDKKYGKLSQREIGLLCGGIHSSTVCKILKGDYDHLLSETPNVNSEVNGDVTTVIPYETLKQLLACEYAIESLLKMSKLSTNADNVLFFDYRATFSILSAYMPEKVNNRLEELNREEEING